MGLHEFKLTWVTRDSVSPQMITSVTAAHRLVHMCIDTDLFTAAIEDLTWINFWRKKILKRSITGIFLD